jgi:hypothetical protein
LCHETSVHGTREFGSTGAMITRVDILWRDLGNVVLGYDVSVAIHGGVAFEHLVARVVVVERSHPTYEDGGLSSVLQSILCHSYVPHYLRLYINNRCSAGSGFWIRWRS